MNMKYLLFLLVVLAGKTALACNVSISSPTSSICFGDSLTLTATASGNATFVWMPGNVTGNSITVSPATTTTYTVTSTDTSGCVSTKIKTITVNLLPVVSVSATLDTICVGISTTLMATGANSYMWMPGNIAAQTITVSPLNTSTYTVIGTASATGCTKTVLKTIYVKSAPKPILADSNILYPFSNCSNTSGLPLYHLNVSTPFQSSITSYAINWGDGSGTTSGISYASFPLSHNYNAYGVFSLVFTANYTNGCHRDTNIFVINQTNPAIGIQNQFGGNTQGCAPVQFCFKMTNYASNSPGTTYFWNFGDGSTVLWTNSLIDSICHTYTTSSCGLSGNQFEVSVTAINSCDSTKASINNIKIFTKPIASFVPSNTSGCINVPINFVNNSTLASNSPNCNSTTLFTWNFGDPASGAANTVSVSSLATQSHAYAAPGYYTVRLIATGTCGSDTTQQVICIENPIATFTATAASACAPSVYTFTNTSPGLLVCAVSPYTWSVTKLSSTCAADSISDYVFISGTSTSSVVPVIRFNNQGIYQVRLTHTAVCGVFFKDTVITIKRKPLVSIQSPTTICSSETLQPTATVTNCGTNPLTYLWTALTAISGSPSTATNPAFTFPAGTHTITLQVTNECGTSNSSVTVLVNPIPTVAIASSPATSICVGQSITLTASGANTYSWSWAAGSASGAVLTQTPNATTTYTVTATSLNSCTKSQTVTITVNPLPSLSVVTGVLSCVPGNDASITITGSGGLPTYQYGLNGSYQLSNSYTALGAGTYTVSIKDAHNCTSSLIQTIIAPNAPAIASSSSVNVSCNAGSNGSINVTGSGGAAPLQYILQPGAVTNATGVFTSLAAGSYTVTVKDALGCTNSVIKVITQPLAPLSWVSATTTPVNCFGNATGSISTTATGGTAAYSYTLQPGAVTNSTGLFTGKIAGTYTVTVTDVKGCTLSTTVVITQPALLAWSSVVVTNALCNATATGSITASTTGGSGIITYSLLPGSASNTTGSFLNLTAATYTIQASDANGCTKSSVVLLTQPTALTLTNLTHLSPSCVPGGDGSISFSGSGGTLAYQYGLNGTYQTTSTFSSLAAATYTISVKDANACTVTSVYALQAPNAPTIASSSSVNVSCYGGSNGSINVVGAGGTGALQYILQPSTITNTTGVFTSLVAGSYTVTVKDIAGCTSSILKVITQPLAALSWVSATTTPVTCNGTAMGSISTTATGGTVAYSYTLQPGSSVNSTGVFTGKIAGTYTVTVTDANGCTTSTALVITQPTQLVWGLTNSTNVSCFGGSNASSSLAASGGSGTITYTLLPIGTNNTTGSFSGLSASVYTVNASDANGCSITSLLSITQPLAVSISNISNASPSCVPGNDGSISVTGSGGVLPYLYSISPLFVYTSTSVFTSLGTSTYTMNIKDANGCTASATQTIIAPNAPVITSISKTDVSCVPGNDGTILANVSNGALPYQYALDPPSLLVFQSANAFNSLPVGTYTIVVKDAVGCTNSSAVSILPHLPPAISNVSKTDASCSPGCDGSITVSATGSSLQYKINTGAFQSSAVFNAVCANAYTITVKDMYGCTATATTNIATVGSLNLSIAASQQVSCNGGTNGSITILATGGTGTVSYTLLPGGITNTSGSYSSLSAGTFTITATDANGCSKSTLSVVTQPALLSWNSSSSTNVSCFGGANASITLTTAGGSGIIHYTLLPSGTLNTSGIFSGLNINSYTVNAVDANGCSISTTSTITQPTAMLITSITSTIPSCNPGNDATMTILNSGGSPSYTYSIGAGNQSSHIFPNIGAGTYTVTITDTHNCTITSIQSIVTPNAPIISNTTHTNVSCNTGSNGSIAVTAGAGTGALTFTMQPGAISNASGIFLGLSSTMYTISVTDAIGCVVSTQVNVTQPTPLSFAAPTITNVSCYGGSNAVITAVATGGTGSINYVLQPGNVSSTTATFASLSAGTYTVLATDANGCTNNTVLIVTQPTPVVWGLTSSSNVSCNGGSNGAININASGGSGQLSYTLFPSATTTTNGIFSALNAGAYTIQASDANGCTISSFVSITQPGPLVIDSITNSVPTCLPGSLAVFASGGSAPYSFSSNGSSFVSNNTFANLPAGVYTLTVKDAHSCTTTSTHTMTIPNAPFFTNLTITNATCNGSNNGSVSNLTANGGAGSFVFSILPSGSFTNLSPNTYTVIVTDANSCSSSTTVAITEPTAVSLVSLTHTNMSCHNITDGSIYIACTGGTGVLHYTLLPQNITNLTGVFVGLNSNIYTLVVKDDSNCVFTTTSTIINPAALIYTSVSSSPISCNGNTNASIVVITSGGTGSYNYAISPALSPSNTTGIFTSLSANQYTVTVYDTNNCSRDTTVSITQPPPVMGSFLVQQNVSCFGGSNGAFTVFPNAGWAPFTYYLLGSTVSNTTGVFNNMPAGTYSVQLVDSAFCSTLISPIIVSEPTQLIWDSIINPLIPCHGDVSDLVRVFVSGGIGIKTCTVSPLGPQTNSTGQFTGLTSQVYTITAKDANNCTLTTIVNVTQNPEINFNTFELHPPTCYADQNGSILSTVSGGTPPLNYQLNTLPVSAVSNFTNLGAGFYTVTVQDALTCKKDTIVQLIDPDQVMLADLTVGSVICPDSSDAEIHLLGAGGTGHLTYCLLPDSVSNVTGDFYLLPTGTYSLIIKDSLGCFIDSTVFVSPSRNPMSITMSSHDLGCFGIGTEGWAEADVIGGAHPYTYAWNTTPPQVDMRATELRFGYYIVQVTDFKGCSIWDTVYINPGTCCEEVFLPNAFSPNGDGVNDVFRAVTSAGIQLIHFSIYNRWGQLVWKTNDYTKGWDGNFNGESSTNNSTTYYYMFNYKCLTDGNSYMKKGDVMVIK